MNWKLIFLLSLFGLAMGVSTVWFIPSMIEPFFWLAVFLISAFLIAKYAPGSFFLHGLFVSLANCVWVTGLHIAMFQAYLASHPDYLPNFPPDWAGHPRRTMLLTGPIIGVMSGLVLGLFAWVASKIFKKTSE